MDLGTSKGHQVAFCNFGSEGLGVQGLGFHHK